MDTVLTYDRALNTRMYGRPPKYPWGTTPPGSFFKAEPHSRIRVRSSFHQWKNLHYPNTDLRMVMHKEGGVPRDGYALYPPKPQLPPNFDPTPLDGYLVWVLTSAQYRHKLDELMSAYRQHKLQAPDPDCNPGWAHNCVLAVGFKPGPEYHLVFSHWPSNEYPGWHWEPIV